MTYTIGEIAEKFHLPISTIRYYEKEGLLPPIRRENGIRKFSDSDFETIFIIECLKKTNVELKDIQRFVAMALEGDSTIDGRLSFFREQVEKTKRQIADLQRSLRMLEYKEWYYSKAKELGSTRKLEEDIDLYRPKEIKDLYDRAHRKED